MSLRRVGDLARLIPVRVGHHPDREIALPDGGEDGQQLVEIEGVGTGDRGNAGAALTLGRATIAGRVAPP